MTKETRTIIEPQDIVAAEFECRSCHVRLTIRVSEFVEPRQFCPHCNQKWFPNMGGNASTAVHRLVSGIREYCKAAENPDVELGVVVRYQLTSDSEAEV